MTIMGEMIWIFQTRPNQKTKTVSKIQFTTNPGIIENHFGDWLLIEKYDKN